MTHPICGISHASKQHALPEMPDSLCLKVHDGNLPWYKICVVVVGDQLSLHRSSPTSDNNSLSKLFFNLFKITLSSCTTLIILQASYNFLTKGSLFKRFIRFFPIIQSFSVSIVCTVVRLRAITTPYQSYFLPFSK